MPIFIDELVSTIDHALPAGSSSAAAASASDQRLDEALRRALERRQELDARTATDA
ncbi:MAG TPA: hypothetical protein VJ804_12375 [Acidimicrobiales bacterium]|nr:hypothetical protein [Acidimicrobiales bacterium]